MFNMLTLICIISVLSFVGFLVISCFLVAVNNFTSVLKNGQLSSYWSVEKGTLQVGLWSSNEAKNGNLVRNSLTPAVMVVALCVLL